MSLSTVLLISAVYSKAGKHQACDTSSFVRLAPSITNPINLLKLTRINCLGEATWHWSDLLLRQLGVWPLVNLMFRQFICVCLFLWQMCAQPLRARWEVLPDVGQLQMHLWRDGVQRGHLPQLWVPMRLPLNLYLHDIRGSSAALRSSAARLIHALNPSIPRSTDLWLFLRTAFQLSKSILSCPVIQKTKGGRCQHSVNMWLKLGCWSWGGLRMSV